MTAADVLEAYRHRGWRLATAESCTGGMIAAALTAIPGSSDVVECGYVTYSNAAKSRMLGVDARLIAAHGAVSRQVAGAMAVGARDRSGVEAAVSVTGIAGPGGGSADKPVGLVWFGLAVGDQLVHTVNCIFPGDRDAIRAAAVQHALMLLSSALLP